MDFSEQFLELARKRTVQNADRIEYRLVDATDETQLVSLGQDRFDAAVCTMAFMDMASIGPLASALPQILKSNGHFVFSVLHPCFNNSNSRLTAEEEYRDGELVQVLSVKTSQYVHPWAERGIGMRGQPHTQLYFNRPLHELLKPFLDAGFVLDGLEEPAFEEAPPDMVGFLSWQRFREITPVLVARLRLR